MFTTILSAILAIAIAIFGGAASVWYALDVEHGFGSQTVGVWTSYPDLGSSESDPYSKARVAREGILVLGRAEGLTFAASTDSSGEGLRRECTYVIEGTIPQARFWTLFAADAALTPITNPFVRPAAVQSQAVLRLPGNGVSVTVSPHASPGNWLETSGKGEAVIVLTLYDTSLTGGKNLSDIELPQVLRKDCDA